MMNGYTSPLFESKVGLFLNKKFRENSTDNDDDSDCNTVFGPDQFKVYIALPYMGALRTRSETALTLALVRLSVVVFKLKISSPLI